MPGHGWYNRGYMPHCDHEDLEQFITFRLADSVPTHLITQWRNELIQHRNLPVEHVEKYSEVEILYRPED